MGRGVLNHSNITSAANSPVFVTEVSSCQHSFKKAEMPNTKTSWLNRRKSIKQLDTVSRSVTLIFSSSVFHLRNLLSEPVHAIPAYAISTFYAFQHVRFQKAKKKKKDLYNVQIKHHFTVKWWSEFMF